MIKKQSNLFENSNIKSDRTKENYQAYHFNNEGLNFLSKGLLDAASSCFIQAIACDDQFTNAYINLGNLFLNKGMPFQAEKNLRKALKLEPQNPLVHYNLAIILGYLNDINGSISSYKKCISLEPKNTKALRFLGNCLKDNKDFGEALKIYRKWEKIEPQNPEVRFCQSSIHIRHGRFNLGWKMYEAGLQNNIREMFKDYHNDPVEIWNGKPFNGTLMVYGEQGIGDQILFGTLLQDLSMIQKSISIQVDARLEKLFQRTFPNINVFPLGSNIKKSEHKKKISMGSLCKFFRSHTNDFKNSPFQRYFSDQQLNEKISKILPFTSGLKIGLSWHTFATRGGEERSLSSHQVSNIISNNNNFFINIQYGKVDYMIDEIEKLSGKKLYSLPDVDITKNIEALISLIENCDLIITIDNSTAHLAASLGKPVWVLLPYSADFRWFEKIEFSLWYENTTLIRQDKTRVWDGSIKKIQDAINTVPFSTNKSCRRN